LNIDIFAALFGILSGTALASIIPLLSVRKRIFAFSGLFVGIGLMLIYITTRINQELTTLTVEQAAIINNLNIMSALLFVMAVISVIVGIVIKDTPEQAISKSNNKEILIHKITK
jgi:hypothetical protein